MRTRRTRLIPTSRDESRTLRPVILTSALALALVAASGAAWLAWPALAAGAAPDAAEDADAPEADRVGAVVGRVRDADGNGVDGLLVRIPARELSTFTGVDGEYRFYRVPAGPVVLTVEVAGDAVTQRMVRVNEGVVHEINLRIGEARATEDALVLQYEGRVACTAVAAGAPVACADGADHVVNVTGPWRFARVHLAWEDDATPLNLTAAFDPAREPVTRRPVSAHGTDGAGPLTLLVPLDPDALELVVRARPGAAVVSGPVDVPYVLTVTLLPHAPPE